MYIPDFWCGVITGAVATFLTLIICVAVSNAKKRK